MISLNLFTHQSNARGVQEGNIAYELHEVCTNCGYDILPCFNDAKVCDSRFKHTLHWNLLEHSCCDTHARGKMLTNIPVYEEKSCPR